MAEINPLKREEQAAYALRSLYGSRGYRSFKMSKFEEYALYLENRDFLISDRIISFTDTNSRLMALKPDVTLSIVKNGRDAEGCKDRLCYNENVYRVSAATGQFREIMQAGLECMGDIDLYAEYEVLSLAAESLGLISENFALDISDLRLLAGLLDSVSADEKLRRELSLRVAARNVHELEALCAAAGCPRAAAARLLTFTRLRCPLREAPETLAPFCVGPEAEAALGELAALAELLSGREGVYFDASVLSHMSYYNGLVFRGYIDGVSEGILSGGRYDKLMQKMGRSGGAIGFAVYLDLLGQLGGQGREYDVDVLLLYDENCPPSAVAGQAEMLRSEGKSVSCQRRIPERLRYRELYDMRGGAPC